MKDPPDKCKIIKVPLTTIIKNKGNIGILFDALKRNHELTIHTYQFLRLWILKKYHDNENIPEITEDIIRMTFKALVTKSQGPKPKNGNNLYYNEFMTFYDETYKDLGYSTKLNGNNLSSINGYMSTTILTAIENNIKNNFMNYINRFVNSSLEDKTISKKELKKELRFVKNDIVNSTLTSNSKYHKWIIEHRKNIIPQGLNLIEYKDINDTPQRFLKSMIYMNIVLEKLGRKMFQFFPLRKNAIPKHVTIDTKSIIEILIEDNKNDILKDIAGEKDKIWNTFFKMNSKIFKLSKCTFNYQIITDGYAASIQFIKNKYLDGSNKKKKLMKEGRATMKTNTKNMSEEEKLKYKEKIKKDKKEAEKLRKNQLREEYNKLSKQEKKKFNEEKKNKKKNGNESTRTEFPYLDELSGKEIEDLVFNCIYCDPGKRDLLTFIDDNDNVMTYSIRRRHHETKIKKYKRIINNTRSKKGILDIESELSLYNSKSCTLETFKEYITAKNNANTKLINLYSDKKFRQYKWYSYINTKRSEDNLLNEIDKKYSTKDGLGNKKKLCIIMGDWSIGKQLRNFVPTPNIRLKRLLKKRFNVYNFDEYNTSKLHYKTEEKCKNLYITDKKGKSRKLHSVLTFNMKNKRRGCINRDINAVKNIRKLTDYWLNYNDRPSKYKRESNLKVTLKKSTLKSTNPTTLSVER